MMLKLSSPWVIRYREINAMFKDDAYVKVVFDEDELEVKLYVEGVCKALALTKLLIPEIEFGNVTLKVTVVPASPIEDYDLSVEDIFKDAFLGNPAFRDAETVKNIFPQDLVYVVFAKEVVQYFTDNLGDRNGVCSTLYQTIAPDIFNKFPNVYYCTDVKTDELITLYANNCEFERI